jgi:uncharacterized protein (DUF1778 family)
MEKLTMTKSARAHKDETIQIRASANTKALLNQAATLRGQKLSEFLLESGRRRAEETFLDQNVFLLEPEEHERFVALLDSPPELDAEARRRLTRKPPWQS